MGIIKKQSSFNTLIAFIGLVLGAVNILYLYRIYYTSEQFGLINLLLSISVVYSQLSALGVINTAVKFFPIYDKNDRIHNGFLNVLLVISVKGFILISAVYLIFENQIKDAFAENSPLFLEYYYEVIALSLFTLMFIVAESVCRIIHRTILSAFLRDVVLRLLTTIGILLYAFGLFSFKFFIWYFIFSNLFVFLVLLVQILKSKKFSLKLSLKIPYREVKELYRYGLYSLMAFSSYYITLNIDRIMLGSMVGLDVVGAYTIFLFVATVISFPTRAMSRIIVPVIANHWKENEHEQINDLYKRSSLSLLILCQLIFVGILVNQENLLMVLNKPEYTANFLIFVFLGFSYLIDAAGSVNSDILATSKFYRFDTLFNMIFLFMGIVLNLTLIPILQGAGAALATCLAMVVFNFLKSFFLKKRFGFQPFSVKHIWILLTGGISFLVVNLIPDVDNLVLNILIKSSAVVVIYVPLMYFLKISEDFNSLVKNLLIKPST